MGHREQENHQYGRLLTRNELPVKKKLGLWKKEQVDKISEIPHWLRVAGIALLSLHPHTKAMEEGLNVSDIDAVRTNVAITFAVAALSLAAGACISIIH